MSGTAGFVSSPSGSTTNGRPGGDRAAPAPRIATALLGVFLLAVIVALAITVDSAAPTVRIIATGVVSPMIALSLVLLYFERRRRPWSFAGAALLGAIGVVLRLAVNTQPQLEVGGGLPVVVTIVYVSLGLLVIASSLLAAQTLRRA